MQPQRTCVVCRNPSTLNFAICESCRSARRAAYAVKAASARAGGPCVSCADGMAVIGKTRCQPCADKSRKKSELWRESNPGVTPAQRSYGIRKRKEQRRAVFSAYGNQCACCGESEPLFLTIDHINGGAPEHRRQSNLGRGGAILYAWLIRNEFPEGFQTLCFNCNWAKHSNRENGGCPHQLTSLATTRDSAPTR